MSAETFSVNVVTMVAVGQGDNTIAYSNDGGIKWTGLGNSIFTDQGRGVAWNGKMWVAVGYGTNTIAYSNNGIVWTGVAVSPFTKGKGVAWNGKMWVAVGSGTTNTIAYSYDGIKWTGVTSSPISSHREGVAWNAVGKMWVAVGQGVNTIAYSYNGIEWKDDNVNSPLTHAVYGVAWNGKMWVAVGELDEITSIAYSYDGINWMNINWMNNNYIILYNIYGVAWNGNRWVAVGEGNNQIAYSNDGIMWNHINNYNTVESYGYGVAWNGNRWVAVGDIILNGTGGGALIVSRSSIVYSDDGINWTGVTSSPFNYGTGVASSIFPEPEPETTIQCLNQTQSNSVQIENNPQLGNVYIFNNVSYNSNGFIGVNNGIYQLTGIPSAHPIGFVINDTSKFEITQGTPSFTNTINGITVNYYTGDITFQVKDEFSTISYVCYYHGYMGGQNRFKYSTSCPIVVPLNISIINEIEDQVPIVNINNPIIVVDVPVGLLTSGSSIEKSQKRAIFLEKLFTDNVGLADYPGKITITKAKLLGNSSIITKNTMVITKASNTDVAQDISQLNTNEAIYVVMNNNDFIVFNTSNGKLKIKRISEILYNIYEGYANTSSLVTKTMSIGETSSLGTFVFVIGGVSGQLNPEYTIAPTRMYSMRSLFTNNARVYYKPHSLSAGGIGGVRNARHKHRKT